MYRKVLVGRCSLSFSIMQNAKLSSDEVSKQRTETISLPIHKFQFFQTRRMNLQYISLLLSAAIFLSSTIEAAGEPDDNEHEGERRRRSSHDSPILRDGKEDEHRHEHNLMNLNIHTSTSMGTSEGVTYNMAGGMPPSGEEDYDDHRFVVKFEEEEFQVELANFKRRLLEDSASTFSPSDDYHEDTVRSAVEEKFLIRENAEIMTLMSDVEVDEMRKRPGVMYVERGKISISLISVGILYFLVD